MRRSETRMRTGRAGRSVTAGRTGMSDGSTGDTSNRRNSTGNAAVISSIAKPAPMHDRGPAPNGKYAYRGGLG